MKTFFVDEKKVNGEFQQEFKPYQKDKHYPNKFVYLEKRDLLLVGGQTLQHREIIAVADNCGNFTPDLEESEVVTAGKVTGREISWGSIGLKIYDAPSQELQEKIRDTFL